MRLHIALVRLSFASACVGLAGLALAAGPASSNVGTHARHGLAIRVVLGPGSSPRVVHGTTASGGEQQLTLVLPRGSASTGAAQLRP